MYCKCCGKKMADNVCNCPKCGWVDVSKMPAYPSYTIGVQAPPKAKKGEKVIQMVAPMPSDAVYIPQSGHEEEKQGSKAKLYVVLSLFCFLLAVFTDSYYLLEPLMTPLLDIITLLIPHHAGELSIEVVRGAIVYGLFLVSIILGIVSFFVSRKEKVGGALQVMIIIIAIISVINAPYVIKVLVDGIVNIF